MFHGRRVQRPISKSLAAAFAITQASLLILVLFPLLPSRVHVKEGDIVTQTITAPRSFSYNSEVVRQRLRETAAANVKSVIIYDITVRETQNRKLEDQLRTIDDLRATALPRPDGTGTPATDQVSGAAPSLRITALGLDSAQWQATATEARRVLGEVLQEPFAASDLGAKRATVAARVSPNLDPAQRQAVIAIVSPLIEATEKVDPGATEAQRQRAIEAVPPQVRSFARNQDIVREGDPIGASDLEAMRAAGLLSARLPLSDLASLTLIACGAATMLALHLLIFQPASLASYRRVMLLAILIAGMVLLAKVYLPIALADPRRRFYAFALPIPMAPMLIAALFEPQLALFVAGLVALLAGFTAIYLPELSGAVGPPSLELLQLLFSFTLAGIAGMFAVRGAERLSRYLLAGVWTAAAGFASAASVWWLDGSRHPADLIWILLACSMSGALSALLTVGIVALVTPFFRITTRLQLMELGQLNAPLLRRLQDEAPGTFHHSILVGNLAERAADLVGADSLLVRVGCYYHDIGKMSRPGFFIENQLSGESPHAPLAPAESARIITEHVRYGQELARRHGLPDILASFVAEHHGTRMVSYFYRKAAQADPDVKLEAFAYPGPRPHSRETAIVMLADSIEAAARAATGRDPEQIDALVESVLNERIAEGQLDECELTLSDLRIVAESFKASLKAIYHPRIEYPAPTPLEEARTRRRAGNMQ